MLVDFEHTGSRWSHGSRHLRRSFCAGQIDRSLWLEGCESNRLGYQYWQWSAHSERSSGIHNVREAVGWRNFSSVWKRGQESDYLGHEKGLFAEQHNAARSCVGRRTGHGSVEARVVSTRAQMHANSMFAQYSGAVREIAGLRGALVRH